MPEIRPLGLLGGMNIKLLETPIVVNGEIDSSKDALFYWVSNVSTGGRNIYITNHNGSEYKVVYESGITASNYFMIASRPCYAFILYVKKRFYFIGITGDIVNLTFSISDFVIDEETEPTFSFAKTTGSLYKIADIL